MTPQKRHLHINRNVYPMRGRSDEYGFVFSPDLQDWIGFNSAKRKREYDKKKKAA